MLDFHNIALLYIFCSKYLKYTFVMIAKKKKKAQFEKILNKLAYVTVDIIIVLNYVLSTAFL